QNSRILIQNTQNSLSCFFNIIIIADSDNILQSSRFDFGKISDDRVSQSSVRAKHQNPSACSQRSVQQVYFFDSSVGSGIVFDIIAHIKRPEQQNQNSTGKIRQRPLQR